MLRKHCDRQRQLSGLHQGKGPSQVTFLILQPQKYLSKCPRGRPECVGWQLAGALRAGAWGEGPIREERWRPWPSRPPGKEASTFFLNNFRAQLSQPQQGMSSPWPLLLSPLQKFFVYGRTPLTPQKAPLGPLPHLLHMTDTH